MGWCQVDTPENLKKRIRDFSEFCSPKDGNLFINHEFSDAWLAKKQVRLFEAKHALFLLRKRRGCSRCYFLSKDLAFLQEDFREFFAEVEEPIITSVLDQRGMNQELKNRLADSGFSLYARMQRIVKVNQNPKKADSKVKVHYATMADFDQIQDIILKNFDPLIDQNPDPDEIEQAIREERILVEYEPKEHRVAGISSFERQGVTLYARYLATAEEYRKVASYVTILWRNLLRLHNDAKRFVGWVREENSRAMELNRILGLIPDGVQDEIFIYNRKR